MGNGPLSMPTEAPNVTCATANETRAQSCFGRGVCAPDAVLKYAVCVCAPKYDARSFCELSVYDLYATRGVAFFATVIVVHVFFLALFVYDVVADVCHRPARSLRSAPFAAKLVLVVYCLVHIADTALQLREALGGIFVGTVWQGVIDIVAGRSFLIGIAYLAVCVSWLDLLLRAKNLGVPDRTVRRLRMSVIVLCAVLYPLVGALALVVVTSRSAQLQAALNIVSATIALLGNYYCVIMITVLVIRVLRWLARLDQTDGDGAPSGSTTVRRVRRRGRLVLIMNALNIVLTVTAAGFQAVAAPLAPLFFARLVFYEVVAIANLVLMFLFLENYLFGHTTPLGANIRRVLGRTAPETSSTGAGGDTGSTAAKNAGTDARGVDGSQSTSSTTTLPGVGPATCASKDAVEREKQSEEASEVSELPAPST